MKFYGIEIAQGAEIQNLVVERGDANPLYLGQADKGRLFYNNLTATVSLWNGTAWISLVPTAAVVNGVSSFNTRAGAVTLNASDLTGLIISSNLPIASAGSLGAIKVGSGLAIDGGGILSATAVSGGGGGTTIVNVEFAPVGVRMLFAQPSAPVGWTQEVSEIANNRMLRVVAVAGGSAGDGGTGGNGYGGTNDPTIMNVTPSHTHTFTGSALAAHTHTDSGHTHPGSAVAYNGFQVNTANGGAVGGTTGSSKAKISSNSAGIPAGTISANAGASNWTPKYVNIIICTKG